MTDYAQARTNMVDGQILTNKVTNQSVVEAFLNVQREKFAASTLSAAAYIDEDLPLAPGRYMIEPMVLARLLQFAAITLDDTVLDVGAGTGYCAALLARFAKSVVALESNGDLVARAKPLLEHIANVSVAHGDLAQGHAAHAPYDVIILSGGAVSDVPKTLIDQLADGGRLLAVLNKDGGTVGHAVLVEKDNGAVSRRVLFDAGTRLLAEFAPAPSFTF